MKRSNLQLVVLLGLVLVIVFLTSCGGSAADATVAAPAAADSGASAGDGAPPAGDGEFQPPTDENGNPVVQGVPMGGAAFGEVNQLVLGTLYLQSTDYPITAEQAATLLPLWQEYQSQQSAEEFDAEQAESLLADIEAGLTADQQAVIEAIPVEDLLAWAQDQGLTEGFAPQDGDRPNFEDMSDEERATLQAGLAQQGPPEGDAPQGNGQQGGGPQGGGPQGGGFRGGGFASPLIDAVIAMLEDLA